MSPSATDIGRFHFCQLQWWALHQEERRDEKRLIGVRKHVQKAREAQRRRRLHEGLLRQFLLVIMVVLLSMVASELAFGRVVTLPYADVAFYILSGLSATGLFLLYRREKQVARVGAEHGLIPGRILYGDPTLYSEKVPLSGKPDYIVASRDGVIPVEIKTSPFNGQPYDNHLVQLASYFILVEEAYGEKPPYGLLDYTSGEPVKVENTEALRERVHATLKAMHAAEVAYRVGPTAGQIPVRRSHESPGKCASCFVECTERLVPPRP